MTTRKRLSFLVLLIVGWMAPGSVLAENDETTSGDELITIVQDVYPDWSPDGKKIAFHSNRTSFANRDGANVQIFVLDLATREITQLTHGSMPSRDPVWSPDGKQIVYSVGEEDTREIYVMEADGSNKTRITENEGSDFQAKWFPDGKGIVFDSDRAHNPDDRITNIEVFTMSPDGSNVERLTSYSDWDTFASISPDGSRVVWRRVTTNADGTRNAEVFVMDRDGSNLKQLTDDPAFDSYPTWSPDGEMIMFSSNRDGDHYEDFNIYWVAPDGTGLRRITDTIHSVEQIRARFSPDGTRIVYNRQYLDGRIDMHVMDCASLRP